jgi:hypothetical protein
MTVRPPTDLHYTAEKPVTPFLQARQRKKPRGGIVAARSCRSSSIPKTFAAFNMVRVRQWIGSVAEAPKSRPPLDNGDAS